MCGICFAIRPIAILQDFGPSNPNDEARRVQPDSSANGTSCSRLAGESEALHDDSMRAETRFLDPDDVWSQICAAVKPRGPDADASITRRVVPKSEPAIEWEMRAYASVLHMRGGEHGPPTVQPFVGDGPTEDFMIFNGEIFDGINIPSGSNDGQAFFDELQGSGGRELFSILNRLEGPYAFVYYHAALRRMYFARDPLGRRSLLISLPSETNSSLYLASCAPSDVETGLENWEEVSCEAVYALNLSDINQKYWNIDFDHLVTAFPRQPKSSAASSDTLLYPFDRLLRSIPSPSDLLPVDDSSALTRRQPVVTPQMDVAIEELRRTLETSLRHRVLNVPQPPMPSPPSSTSASERARIAILFSGGLDCTTLALLADRILPVEQELDLINVAFENPRVAAGKERQQMLRAKAEAGRAKVKGKGRAQARRQALAQEDTTDLRHGDDTNRKESQAAQAEDFSIYDVPDRLTGRATWRELRQLRPGRRWNFVEVDVPYQEMLTHRAKVLELMRPQNTVMDLSIAVAFYFAARGIGALAPTEAGFKAEAYTSVARVLLSGLGADELLGGYARHRRAYESPPGSGRPGQPAPAPAASTRSNDDDDNAGNWLAVLSELQMDLDRLPTRNLGRDDRIISFHGKEVRYPFLAAPVVDFLARTPVWLKLDFRFSNGVGDKMLLRMLAKREGLKEAAELEKRAIHFGARTAKMELGSGKHKGETVLE